MRVEAGSQAAPLKPVRQLGVARTGIHPLSRSFETLLKGGHASSCRLCSPREMLSLSPIGSQ